MTTTIDKTNRTSPLRRPVRDRGHSRRSRDHGIRTRRIAHDLDGATLEERKPASSRAAFVSGAKAIVPVLVALVPLAVAFGTTAKGSGLSTLEALGMSVFILGGAAQLAAVPLISAGASVAVVVLTVLVINLRLALYSASIAPHFRRLPAAWKVLVSYHLTDPAYAATITRFDDGETEEPVKRWYFLGVALAIWVTWQAASMLGVFLGSWASDAWSLDFVLPLTFIALAVPAIKDRTTGAAALAAGGTAVFAAALPLNLGLISAAFVGILGGLLAESVTERRNK